MRAVMSAWPRVGEYECVMPEVFNGAPARWSWKAMTLLFLDTQACLITHPTSATSLLNSKSTTAGSKKSELEDF